MKSPTVLAAITLLAATCQAQTSTYVYTAGAPAPSVDPLVPYEKTPDWPKNFGGAPIPFGPAPTGCAKFEILIARGTSEPGPFGSVVGDPLLARVIRAMPGVDVRGYAVQYTANMTSISAGAADITRRLAQQSKDCPDERFALVGYSQGAMAMHGATIPPAIASKVLALVMYGDPALAAFGGTFPGELGQRELQNCAGQDFVCLNIFKSGEGHISYNTKGTNWHDKSAEFIKAAFEGKPLEGSTGKDWKASWLGSAV